MTTATRVAPTITTAEPPNLRELMEKLGHVPLSRVLAEPAPGTATRRDVQESERRYQRLYELVDGVLVEKTMGYRESLFALFISRMLLDFVEPRNLGLVSGADGIVEIFPGLFRIPDVAFASWDRFPDRTVPKVPIPSLVPDLAVEVLGESNTSAEMARKRGEYFAATVRLIWEFDLEARIVTVYTPDGKVSVLDSSKTLDGGSVLPGFKLALCELFAKLDLRG